MPLMSCLKKKEEDKTNYLVNDKGVPCGNTHNFLTQVGPNDPAGFDVVGCRYDMKSSPQNNSIYGPPLVIVILMIKVKWATAVPYFIL